MSIKNFRDWFDRYVAGFSAAEDTAPDVVTNIRLKKDHSERVVREILWIADLLNLDDGARNLAAITALFHDIGRFEQAFPLIIRPRKNRLYILPLSSPRQCPGTRPGPYPPRLKTAGLWNHC